MKKILLLVLLLPLFFTGCTEEKPALKEAGHNEILEQKLVEYGTKLYKENIEGYIKYKDGDYIQTVTLDQFKSYGYSIDEFKLENSSISCNVIETKIEIKITFDSEGNQVGDINYNPILACD